MAYEYDRFEREDGGGSFLMGLLAGTVLGAGLGMLFAPRAGSDLRHQLTEQTGRLRSTANDAYSQASERVSQMVDRGREAFDRARTGSGPGTTDGTMTGGAESAGGLGNLGSGTGSGTGTGVGTGTGFGTGSGLGAGTSGFGTDDRG
jgi:hypothetical protein